jgi:DNA-binding MarR family transcriptional regulator
MAKSVERFTQTFGSMLRVTARIKSQFSNYQGVDFTGLRLLGHLKTSGPSRLSDLAEVLQVDPALITRQSHVLVDGGFAKRAINPADARGTLLEISESGLQLFANHCEVRNEFFENVFSDWSQDEINQFESSLERFTKALNEKSAEAMSQHKQKQER